MVLFNWGNARNAEYTVQSHWSHYAALQFDVYVRVYIMLSTSLVCTFIILVAQWGFTETGNAFDGTTSMQLAKWTFVPR